ncbi:hypothetical protein HBA54_28070 [Pelagibius litoralis]|uniref:Uncharacterized protein n=1 Tax=Pelagibius litoralis TaxID=374515 RepID=A0A967KFG6_9PROT|nr:hypothetical protein [Pelagibius litoralis]NIA72449.1 hypothetical protein [Pelagibius litoralis]
MTVLENARATIGGNNPPEPLPFEAISQRIDGLYDEAKNWLDGDPVTSQEMADGLNLLIDMIRKAEKEADELRKAENKPYDDGKAEVQARYAPLIGKTKAVKGKTVLALESAKKALTPWLEKLEAEKREAEAKAQAEAEAKRRAAEEAFKASQVTDLAAREEAERLNEVANKAEIAARVAAKDKARAKGGAGRATTLRTYYRHELTDPTEFARWAWQHCQHEMYGFLNDLAKRMVDGNPHRELPGVKIHEEKKAV